VAATCDALSITSLVARKLLGTSFSLVRKCAGKPLLQLFKPSTDSASLPVYFEKKCFRFVLRVLYGGCHKWGVLRYFDHFNPALGANPMSHFLAQVFFGN